jgi:hypothetical protein
MVSVVLGAVMLSAFVLSVIMLSVVGPIVAAPCQKSAWFFPLSAHYNFLQSSDLERIRLFVQIQRMHSRRGKISLSCGICLLGLDMEY